MTPTDSKIIQERTILTRPVQNGKGRINDIRQLCLSKESGTRTTVEILSTASF